MSARTANARQKWRRRLTPKQLEEISIKRAIRIYKIRKKSK